MAYRSRSTPFLAVDDEVLECMVLNLSIHTARAHTYESAPRALQASACRHLAALPMRDTMAWGGRRAMRDSGPYRQNQGPYNATISDPRPQIPIAVPALVQGR